MLANAIDLPLTFSTQPATYIQSEWNKTTNASYDALLTKYGLNGYRSNNSVLSINLSVGSRVIQRSEMANYQPKTALGKRLFALRQAHISKGGRLLNAAEIDEELKLRRGGVNA
jgi:hypothetical protein